MGMYSAPKAPDPEDTAQAQFNYELGSTQAGGIINNPNTYDPYGQTEYSLSGYETITLPDGKTLDIPRYNKTTTLTKDGQRLLNKQNNLGDMAFKSARTQLRRPSDGRAVNWNTDTDFTRDLMTGFRGNTNSQSFNPAAIYANQDRNANTQSFNPLLNGFGLIQGTGSSSFNPLTGLANDVTMDYGPKDGFSEDRLRVENAVFGRGNNLLQESRDSEVARLAAMGLAPGGEAYGRVADQFERSANDLALQAVLAGGDEQSRLLGEERARAQFQNAAAGQKFGQRFGLLEAENARRLGDAQFSNQAELAELQARQGIRGAENERLFGENQVFNSANQSQFAMRTALTQMENARRTGDMNAYNAALEAYNNAQLAEVTMERDSANMQNQLRSAQIGEREALKNAEINRLIGILSGAQVQNPTIPGYFTQGVNAPDYTGLVSSNYANRVAANNALLGGVSGLISGGADILSGSRWVS